MFAGTLQVHKRDARRLPNGGYRWASFVDSGPTFSTLRQQWFITLTISANTTHLYNVV